MSYSELTPLVAMKPMTYSCALRQACLHRRYITICLMCPLTLGNVRSMPGGGALRMRASTAGCVAVQELAWIMPHVAVTCMALRYSCTSQSTR
jgi:hypothetical protein